MRLNNAYFMLGLEPGATHKQARPDRWLSPSPRCHARHMSAAIQSPVPPSRDRGAEDLLVRDPALPAAQVKLAYYRLAKETHPDVIGGGAALLPTETLRDTPRHFRDTSDTPLRGNAPETTPAGRFEGSGGHGAVFSRRATIACSLTTLLGEQAPPERQTGPWRQALPTEQQPAGDRLVMTIPADGHLLGAVNRAVLRDEQTDEGWSRDEPRRG